MQHLDAGTIHAWLDGALPPDEAARVEAHVAECAECAAKVAEARGFIAASSRILTALDDVPREVIPADQARPRISRSFLQAAAVLLVVATGSLLVIRSRPTEKTQRASASNGTLSRVAITTAPKNVAPPAQQTTAAAPTTAAAGSGGVRPRVSPVPRTRVSSSVSGTVIENGNKTLAASVAAPQPAAAVASLAPAPLVVATVPSTAPHQQERLHDTTINITLSRDENRLQAVVTTGVATAESGSLTVLKFARIPGGTRTIYEVTPNRSVTLLEYDSASAPSEFRPIAIDVRGASTPQTGDVVRAGIASSTPAVIPLSALVSAATSSTNTIRWTEESTGKVLVLSGPFPVSDLQAIKQRIERLRSHRGD